MPGQALASNNPVRESRAIYDAEEFVRLAKALALPDRLSRSFERWVLACTESTDGPRGLRIELFREVHVAARAVGVCETTMRAHIRRLENLGLVIPQEDSRFRANKHLVNLHRLRHQDWPEGICPKCRHQHVGIKVRDREQEFVVCGCQTGERVWRREGHRERLVQRTCKCAARAVAPPRRRKGPQSVPEVSSPVPPASPKPAQAAAQLSQPMPPAAPGREIASLVDHVIDGSRQAERIRKLRADLGIRVAELIDGCHGERRGREGVFRIDPGHPDYRSPMARDEAIEKAGFELGLSPEQAHALWKSANRKSEVSP